MRAFVGEKGDAVQVEEDITSQRFDLKSPFSRSSTSLISQQDDRVFISMAYALYTAIAIVELLLELLSEYDEADVRLLKVYIHGVSLAITGIGLKTVLSELIFGRQGTAILVTSDVHSNKNYSFLSAGDWLNKVGAFACWKVSTNALCRASVVDTRHAQMRTRVNFITWKLSIPVFERMRVPAPQRKVLVISSEDANDAPLISLP